MEPFVPIPLLVSLICSALHNDMQIWQNMKVVLSREIWSNALFSACWKCLSSWKILFICLWRNPHSAVSFWMPPSLSSSPHSPSLHFFLPRSVSFSHYFARLSSAHPQGCMEVNTPEKLYSPELLSQSHLQTNSPCCTILPCIIKSQLC